MFTAFYQRFLVLLCLFVVLTTSRLDEVALQCLRYDTRTNEGGEVWLLNPTTGVRREIPAEKVLYYNPFGGISLTEQSNRLYLTGAGNGPFNLYLDPDSFGNGYDETSCFEVKTCVVGVAPEKVDVVKIEGGLDTSFQATWLNSNWFLYAFTHENEKRVVVRRVDSSATFTFPLTLSKESVLVPYVGVFEDHQNFYVAFNTLDQNKGTLYFWSLKEGTAKAYTGWSGNKPRALDISANGKYISYFEGEFNPRFNLIAVETGIRNRVPMAPCERQHRVLWSPDGSYFSIECSSASWLVERKIYSIENVEEFQPFTVRHNGFWTLDSNAYVYIQSYKLIAFYPATNEHLELRPMTVPLDIPHNTLYGVTLLTNGEIGVITSENGKHGFETFNTNTRTWSELIGDSADIIGIYVVNNGSSVLYTTKNVETGTVQRIDIDGQNHLILTAEGYIVPSFWTLLNSKNSQFVFYTVERNRKYDLYVMDIDGKNQQRLLENLSGISDIQTWPSKDSYDNAPDEIMQIAALIVERDGLTRVALYDFQSRRTTIIRDNLTEFDTHGPLFDPNTGSIRFHWQDNAGNYGTDQYGIDGTAHYRLAMQSDAFQMVQLEISPNGRTAAAAIIPPYNNTEVMPDGTIMIGDGGPIDLYLTAADGSWSKLIESSFTGIYHSHAGDLLFPWSGDGKWLAYIATIYWNTEKPHLVKVVDENGKHVRYFGPFKEPGILTWVPCQ